jgi:hypothetical protein
MHLDMHIKKCMRMCMCTVALCNHLHPTMDIARAICIGAAIASKAAINSILHDYQTAWARPAICASSEITTCISHPPCIRANACSICTVHVGVSLKSDFSEIGSLP